MNTKSKFQRVTRWVTVLCALLALLLFSLPSHAQVTTTDYSTFSGVPSVITGGSTSNVLAAIDWRQGKTLAVFPKFVTTNTTTANVVLTFDVSYDGTNYCTAGTISKTNAATSATAVIGYHVILPTDVNSVKKIRLKTMTWADTNSYTLSSVSVVYSWGN